MWLVCVALAEELPDALPRSNGKLMYTEAQAFMALIKQQTWLV